MACRVGAICTLLVPRAALPCRFGGKCRVPIES